MSTFLGVVFLLLVSASAGLWLHADGLSRCVSRGHTAGECLNYARADK